MSKQKDDDEDVCVWGECSMSEMYRKNKKEKDK